MCAATVALAHLVPGLVTSTHGATHYFTVDTRDDYLLPFVTVQHLGLLNGRTAFCAGWFVALVLGHVTVDHVRDADHGGAPARRHTRAAVRPCAGTTNALLARRTGLADVLADLSTGVITVHSDALKEKLALSTEDLR